MATVIETHTHAVIDDDRPFKIDPNTKEIVFDGTPLKLAQRSKNSERLTFTIPATTIEGHDMKACNAVVIHFQNFGQDPGQVSKGVYQVDDLKVENDNVTLSWLVGDEATVYAGGLIFSIHFICTAVDGSIVYDFPTLTYSKITVGPTVWNSETIEREYPDIIAQFAADIDALKTGYFIMANSDGNGNVSLLNVPTTTDDRIIEQGKSKNGWNYEKWLSGTAKCWKNVTAAVKTTDWKDSGMMSFLSYGLFWTSGISIELPYPTEFAFIEHPVETAALSNGTAWLPLTLISTTHLQTDKTDSYRLCTYKIPDKDINVKIALSVAGRWK